MPLSTSSAMGNPLLAIRFVFLGFLIILSIFVLVFAIWNLQASTSAGLTASIPTVISFINAILTFVFVGLGIVDFAVPQKHVFPLWSECVFSGIIACLHLGVSIGATAQAAMICKWDAVPTQCTTVILLLPIGWLSTAVFLIHCLAVVTLTASRSNREPDIWSASMCSRAYLRHELPGNGSSTSLISEGEGDPEQPQPSEPKTEQQASIAPWAPEQNQIRRGRDSPFRPPTPRSTPSPTPRNTLMGTPAVNTQGLPPATSVMTQGPSHPPSMSTPGPSQPSRMSALSQPSSGSTQVPPVPPVPPHTPSMIMTPQGLPLHPRVSFRIPPQPPRASAPPPPRMSAQSPAQPPRMSISSQGLPPQPRISGPHPPRASAPSQGLPSNPRVSMHVPRPGQLPTAPIQPPRVSAQSLPLNSPVPVPGILNLPPRAQFRSESARTHHQQAGSQSSMVSVQSFPARVRNSNAPIPLPDRSEWVRAQPGVPIYNRFATVGSNQRPPLPTTTIMTAPTKR